MNNYYFYEYVELLERVLSFGLFKEYAPGFISSEIANNEFFKLLELSNGSSPYISVNDLIRNIYKNEKEISDSVPVYNQCLWAAESYMRIQQETRLTFESIFIYIPIEEMYSCFPIYHEMDFGQIVSRFNQKRKEQSLLSILIRNYGFTLKEVEKYTGININTLYSLKERKRNIKNLSSEKAIKLASFFHVRVETLIEFEY